MKTYKLTNSCRIAVVLALLAANLVSVPAQTNEPKVKLSSESKRARDYALRMLDEMDDILKEHYYDSKFHGIDLKSRLETAKARVKTLQYNWQMYRVLVQVLMEFNDSHTRMLLPPRSDYFQYGVGWQMIGQDCFVTSVKNGSDASAKGVEVGDQLLSIGRYTPNRNDLWKINYLIYRLDPAETLDLKLKKPDGTEKAITIDAKTMTDKEYRAEQKARRDKNGEKYFPYKCHEVNTELAACRLETFSVERDDIDKMMKFAAKYPKLILDLRGNGGGLVVMEQYLLSYFFDREIKIADMVTKKKTERRVTKILDTSKQYRGEVAVLIDSNSASAAEITARVLQIEKRAKIYGDFSSGSVMTSIAVPFRSMVGALAYMAIIRVGMSVTIGDVIMRDGSRLEHVGVTPDEVLQPKGVALRMKTDAVLAYAAMKFGATLSPLEAGKYHFITEKDEDSDDDET
ncbi:MAG: S41 family peptidase [Pyrinomonadaceae bacterium]